MESINVLREHHEQPAGLLQSHDALMRRIGPGLPERWPAFKFVVPMLDSGGVAPHEIVIINRLAPFPNTLRSAKIRNAAAGGNSRASKDESALGAPDEIDQPL